ncbi:uncharacterized protein SCHCODRAFT_02491498, partial [Schizophyllum commune H4-8]|uniref:uncharacterized protein n=1 Tax=Schizophyllum commune (strain H4-8 / FGSC 9210) TaxID=578458 RepID=UPI00215F957D
DARPVLSTVRLSTHRTGKFAVLGSARGAQIDITRPSRPGRDGRISSASRSRKSEANAHGCSH